MNWQTILEQAFGRDWAKVDEVDRQTIERISKRLLAIAAKSPADVDDDEKADLTAILLNIRGKYAVRFRREFNEGLEIALAIAARVAIRALMGA